jgi:hypothetical protein
MIMTSKDTDGLNSKKLTGLSSTNRKTWFATHKICQVFLATFVFVAIKCLNIAFNN